MSSPSAYSPSSSVPADKPVRRVVFLCKSDNVGGAAIVTRRLMKALVSAGIDTLFMPNASNSTSEVVSIGATFSRCPQPVTVLPWPATLG